MAVTVINLNMKISLKANRMILQSKDFQKVCQLFVYDVKIWNCIPYIQTF